MGTAATPPPGPAPLRWLARAEQTGVRASTLDRDPQLIQRAAPVLDLLTAPFAPQVSGSSNVPATGPVLVVGNHSLMWLPEIWATTKALFERRGIEAPMSGLTYDLMFAVPGLGALLRRAGMIPAEMGAAERALERGELVLVYPGGDLDACRPWSDRNRVELGHRRGFVRLALRTGAPLVPVVAHGAQHGTVVLARGDRIAEALHLPAVRVKVFPIFAGPPLGITSVLTPPLPLPADVSVAFLPPIDWSALGSAAADDPLVVDACYDEVRTAMQEAMDRLAADAPHPVLSALTRIATAPARRALGVALRALITAPQDHPQRAP